MDQEYPFREESHPVEPVQRRRRRARIILEPPEGDEAYTAPVLPDNAALLGEEKCEYAAEETLQNSWQYQASVEEEDFRFDDLLDENDFCFDTPSLQTEKFEAPIWQHQNNAEENDLLFDRSQWLTREDENDYAEPQHQENKFDFSFESFWDRSREDKKHVSSVDKQHVHAKLQAIKMEDLFSWVKENKRLVLVLVAALVLLMVISSFVRTPKWQPKEHMQSVFEALTGETSDEPLVLDLFAEPAFVRPVDGPAKWIVERAEYTILSQSKKGKQGEVKLRIRVPDAMSLINAAVEDMEHFDQQTFEQRFLSGLEQPEMREFEVALEMKQIDGKWYLMEDPLFTDAVTGGMLTAYASLESAVMESLAGGGAN